MLFRNFLSALLVVVGSDAFTVVVRKTTTTSSSSSLNMGLFDGVKEAFSAPALERSSLSSERETPIDRWMGWSVASESEVGAASAVSGDFVDAMSGENYVTVALAKPMGIVFEENDADFGGIFVQSIKEDGEAAKDGTIQQGDQLVAVEIRKVSGLPFDDALGAIIDATPEKVKLIFFRGSAKQLYGPTGASQAWLDEFISGKAASSSSDAPAYDLSVPYDAAARLAYEKSDKSMAYADFKAKYEADAVKDVIAKRKVTV